MKTSIQLACCVLFLNGCMNASLDWRFELDAGVAGAETIGAFVRSGSCSESNERMVFLFARGEIAPVMPSPLGGGTHCFEVVAFDSECRVVGRGVEMLELPAEMEQLVVTVNPSGPAEIDVTCATYIATLGGG